MDIPDVRRTGKWPMSALVPMSDAAAVRGADFVIGVRDNKRAVYTPYRRVVSWGYRERIVRALGAPGGDPGSIKLAPARATPRGRRLAAACLRRASA